MHTNHPLIHLQQLNKSLFEIKKFNLDLPGDIYYLLMGRDELLKGDKRQGVFLLLKRNTQ